MGYLKLLAIATSAYFAAACSCEEKSTSSGDQAPASEVIVSAAAQPSATANSGSTGLPVEVSATASKAEGYAALRLTPEQISNVFALRGNFGAGSNEFRSMNQATGREFDYLIFLYGVPLGGIDFINASVRDPSTKAQTLLIARGIAWSLGQAVVWKEYNLSSTERVVFRNVDLEKDRPYVPVWDDWRKTEEQKKEIADLEQRWATQVEELWWRFFSRPPSATESLAVKSLVVKTIENEGYPAAGWVNLLYSIFATQEFWHL